MKCVFCKNGETQPGKTTVTLERDDMTVVIKGVPARVCQICGEAYLEEEISRRIGEIAESLFHMGVQVSIREYAAA